MTNDRRGGKDRRGADRVVVVPGLRRRDGTIPRELVRAFGALRDIWTLLSKTRYAILWFFLSYVTRARL